MENRILAISSAFNVEKWVDRTINSITKQEYENYKYTIVDDISTDRTVEIANSLVAGYDNISVITNTEKKYSLKNIYEGIHSMNPKDTDIVLTLDGDDWLAHSKVFEIVNNVYEKTGCWMTYGSYMEFPSGNRGIEATPYPREQLKDPDFNFRSGKWRVSHLRTFRYGLFKKIKYDDFLDWNGEFYKTSIDKAFMYPMIEMARERSEFIDDLLYVYNFNNPLNVHKARRQLQLQTSHYLKHNKPPYSKIEKL
tara:strand:+ start:3435 stop:4190 length:756 start_codon:yes stop_codon:yes gene_type:complete